MQPTKKDQKRLEYIITVRYYSGIMYDLHWFMESYPRLNVHIENIDMENQWFPQKKIYKRFILHTYMLVYGIFMIQPSQLGDSPYVICHDIIMAIFELVIIMIMMINRWSLGGTLFSDKAIGRG